MLSTAARKYDNERHYGRPQATTHLTAESNEEFRTPND
jgi:hypothetical protein